MPEVIDKDRVAGEEEVDVVAIEGILPSKLAYV
jgi:hypothetical protein